MIYRFRRNVTVALLLLAAMLLTACNNKSIVSEDEDYELIPSINTNIPESLSVWCLADNPFAPMIQRFSYEYSQENDNINVVCTAFSLEEDLIASLEYEKPDMILYNDMNSFSEQDMLDYNFTDRIPDSIFYPAVIHSVRKNGNAFFPLGTQTTVLAVNRFYWACSPTCYDVGSDVFGNLESFTGLANAYGLAGEGTFYSADSFSDVILSMMCSLGEEFNADSIAHTSSDKYSYVYNLLAENAFNGALGRYDSSAVIDLGLGNIVCGFIASTDAAKLDSNLYDFYPVPLPSSNNNVCPGIMTSLGVTTWNAAKLPYISAFIEALFSDSFLIADTALQNGYIPSVYYSTSSSKGTLANVLCSIAENYDQVLLTSDCSYFSNKDSFDNSFRKNIRIFNRNPCYSSDVTQSVNRV